MDIYIELLEKLIRLRPVSENLDADRKSVV